MMLDKLFANLLNPLLDRLGTGWKAACGLLAMLIILCLFNLGKIDQAQYDTYFSYATLLFGIGIYHAKTTETPKPPSA